MDERSKLVSEHYDNIYKMAYCLVMNEDDAKEITQETFLRFWNGRYTHVEILYRIAQNLSYDYINKRDKTHSHVRPTDAIDTIESGVLPPPEALHRRYLMESVREAVQHLPPKYREVVLLYYYSGLTVRKISEILGITEVNVKTRLRRARKKLKKDLSHIMC